jgi:hypothetical protein
MLQFHRYLTELRQLTYATGLCCQLLWNTPISLTMRRHLLRHFRLRKRDHSVEIVGISDEVLDELVDVGYGQLDNNDIPSLICV